VTGCRPMTLPDLGRRPAGVDDAKTRWKLGWEFLEEYRWEPDRAAPEWTQILVLQRPRFPAELEIQRADALV
jgi:hypothetical protein